MEKERNKFTYIWLSCLLLIFGLCGLGIISTNKVTMAASVGESAVVPPSLKVYTDYDGRKYGYCSDFDVVQIMGEWKWNTSVNAQNNMKCYSTTTNRVVDMDVDVIHGGFTSCGKAYNTFISGSTWGGGVFNVFGYCSQSRGNCYYYSDIEDTLYLNSAKKWTSGASVSFKSGISESCKTVTFDDSTYVDSGFYYWFITVANPYYRCYKDSSGEHVWNNIPSTGTLLSYTDEESCLRAGIKYTVSYNANGGTNAPKSQEATSGQKINISFSEPTRSGYEFVNWNTKKDGSGTTYNSGQSWTANTNLTLYAQWRQIQYTVEYNGNAGSDEVLRLPTTQIKKYGYSLTLSSKAPLREGYDFDSWNTRANGNGTSYSRSGQYTQNANLTLYAQWKEKTYRITYSCSGATNCPSSQTKYYFSNLKLTESEPKRDGYTFIGWKGAGATYKPGSYYKTNNATTLYAQWVKGDNLSRCNIRDNPPTSDKMLLSIGLMILTFVGFGYCCFIMKRVKD